MKPFIFLILCLYVFTSEASLLTVDFDESMGIKEPGRYNLMLRDKINSQRYLNFYRDLYNKNSFEKKEYSQEAKIPKIIHHIWIGQKPFPKLYKTYAKECGKINTGWSYKLWGNDEVEELLETAPIQIREIAKNLIKVYQANKSYEAQKDVLEYLILYKYGGVFLDADVKCIKNMDEIVHKYSFFSALEPPVFWSKVPVMTNAIVGSKPNNEIFIDAFLIANEIYHKIDQEKNVWYKKIFRKIFKGKSFKVPHVKNTMMLSLARALMKNSDDATVFPATYFNPVFPPSKRYAAADQIKKWLGYYKNTPILFKEAKPETIGIQDFYD